MTPAARLAASIELLEAVGQAARRPADAVANGFFRERRYIGSGDRRAVSETVWGVLRAWRRLHWWILSRAQGTATPRLLAAAWHMLGGEPMESAEALFSGAKFAPAPLMPSEKAVLRQLSRQALDHPDMPRAVRLEVPDWVFARLAQRFGPALEPELKAMATPAPLDLRVNLLQTTREEALAALREQGIDAAPTPLSPWGLRAAPRTDITAGAAFREGIVEVQDEGSQLVALLAQAAPGMRVADWCAGAGGKTLAMAMTMQNKGMIVACDVHEKRLEAAVKRLRRAGVHNVERHLIETGGKWVKRRAGTFDRVLVDAPCSGTGTWRRNPDGRFRLADSDLQALLPKQAAILDEASRLVRPGGRLIYATCSLLPEENDAQVAAFIVRQPGFTVLPIAEAGFPALPGLGEGPFLTLTPLRHGTDGFFAAVLLRRPAQEAVEIG